MIEDGRRPTKNYFSFFHITPSPAQMIFIAETNRARHSGSVSSRSSEGLPGRHGLHLVEEGFGEHCWCVVMVLVLRFLSEAPGSCHLPTNPKVKLPLGNFIFEARQARQLPKWACSGALQPIWQRNFPRTSIKPREVISW